MWAGCPLCSKLHPISPLRVTQDVGDPEVLEPLGQITCPTYEVVLYVYRRRGGTSRA